MSVKLDSIKKLLIAVSDPDNSRLLAQYQALLEPLVRKYHTNEQINGLKNSDLRSKDFTKLFKSETIPEISSKLFTNETKPERNLRESIDSVSLEYMSNATMIKQMKDNAEKFHDKDKKHPQKNDGTKNDGIAYRQIHDTLRAMGVTNPKIDQKLKNGGEVAYVTWNGYSKFKHVLEQVNPNMDAQDKKTLARAEEALFQPGYDPHAKPLSPTNVARNEELAKRTAGLN